MSRYRITGDEETYFVLTNIKTGNRIAKCPCCDKLLRTRRSAELLAEHLTKINKEVDAFLAPKPEPSP